MKRRIGMIKPIVLTKFGEILNPDSKTGNDDNNLSTGVGLHDVCGGWFDLRPISETHKALVCSACKLRVVMPAEVTTYGDLRGYLGHLQ